MFFNQKIKIKLLNEKAHIPVRATGGSTGYDLKSMVTLILCPQELISVPTGISLEIPQGLDVQIRPRSGLSSKKIIIPNSPGTIDNDYRGEIKVLLLNLSDIPLTINPGDRIAQLVVAPVYNIIFQQVHTLSTTDRDTGGFGSTGV